MIWTSGMEKLNQLLSDIYIDSRLKDYSYHLTRDLASNSLKLIVWQGNEVFEPILIPKTLVRECVYAENKYEELKNLLEGKISNRIQGGI